MAAALTVRLKLSARPRPRLSLGRSPFEIRTPPPNGHAGLPAAPASVQRLGACTAKAPRATRRRSRWMPKGRRGGAVGAPSSLRPHRGFLPPSPRLLCPVHVLAPCLHKLGGAELETVQLVGHLETSVSFTKNRLQNQLPTAVWGINCKGKAGKLILGTVVFFSLHRKTAFGLPPHLMARECQVSAPRKCRGSSHLLPSLSLLSPALRGLCAGVPEVIHYFHHFLLTKPHSTI